MANALQTRARHRRERTAVIASKLFDNDWYLSQYPDVRAGGIDPLTHYLSSGGFEGRDPNPLFDSDWYLLQNPEVATTRINPLVHYLVQGAAEGRAPNRLFKGQWYLEQYPEASNAGINPLAHYLTDGAAKGFDPNPWFDSDWYLHKNPEVAAAGQNPLAHYIFEGAAQGRAPSPLFKGEWYLENIPDFGPPAAGLRSPRTSLRSPFARSPKDMIFIDVIADVTGGRTGTIDKLKLNPGPLLDIGRLTVLGETSAVGAFATAVAAAKAGKRHVLVLMCGVSISADDIAALARAFDADPFIGYVVPRLALPNGGILPLLPRTEGGALRSHERGILADLPSWQLAPEFLTGCVLIRDQLVINIPDVASHFKTVAGALRAMMAWGRRLGFRALITNRVVLPAFETRQHYPVLEAGEQDTLIRFFPDSALADARFRELSCHYREALLARVRSPVQSERFQLLFDCSGMSPVYNGTNECVLGILDGVAGLETEWRVSVYAPTDAISFHRLRERYKGFTILSGDLTGTYTVAIRLSQPWTIRSIVQLHRHALRVVFLMLDTIAWDIIYAAGPEVEPAWALAAAQADGLLHISNFTKDRFNFRFPVAPRVRQMVTHLSCHYDEYVGSTEKGSAGGHILLIGNDFEHKGLAPALELLPRAFPDQQFVVIGQDNLRRANVTTVRSGGISAGEMEGLFAHARMLVFPSFYEGFGFPIVKGLGHGLDVVARRSDLLSEVGRQCAPRGRLVPFDDEGSLVEVIRRIMDNADLEAIPLGGDIAPGAEPVRWSDVARSILGFAEALAAEPSIAMHDAREAALRFAGSGAGR